MISPLKFFEYYTAISLHFSNKGSYDFFKYGGKTRVTSDTFLKRKDKYFFERCASKMSNDEHAICYILSNIMQEKKYIRNFDEKSFDKWVMYRDGLFYVFKKELNILNDRIVQTGVSRRTAITEMCINDEISKEFVILFNFTLSGKLFEEYNKKDDFLWNELFNNLKKIEPFIITYWNLDQNKKDFLKSILLESLK